LTIGTKIKHIRLKKGMSLRKLASEVGVSASFLCQLENEKTSASLSTLNSLAGSLGVSLSFLVDEGVDMPPVKESFAVTVPNSHRYLGAVSEFVRRVLSAHDFGREAVNETLIVVDELASNIIKYAYPPEVIDVYSLSLGFVDGGVELVFSDRGRPFDATGMGGPEGEKSRGKAGELGLKLVREFTEKIEYTVNGEEGNILKVFKKRSPVAESDQETARDWPEATC